MLFLFVEVELTNSIIVADWELGRGGYGNTSNVVPAQR